LLELRLDLSLELLPDLPLEPLLDWRPELPLCLLPFSLASSIFSLASLPPCSMREATPVPRSSTVSAACSDIFSVRSDIVRPRSSTVSAACSDISSVCSAVRSAACWTRSVIWLTLSSIESERLQSM